MGSPNTKTAKNRSRTYARNRAMSISRRGRFMQLESDGTYLLKLVVVLILGTVWLKFRTPMVWMGLPLGAFPIGTIIALIGIKLLEPDQLNRKIWYAGLIIVTIISYFLPAGIVLE